MKKYRDAAHHLMVAAPATSFVELVLNGVKCQRPITGGGSDLCTQYLLDAVGKILTADIIPVLR